MLAVATGVSVANLYYAQPLLPLIRRSLGLSPGVAGLMITLSQLGYAAGLLLLLPLGDLLERRRLIVAVSVGTSVAMAWVALSPVAGSLLAAAVVVGTLSVVTQMLVPFAATLAGPDERGRVVGTVMSGLLVGVLLARTVAGALAAVGGWRVVFWTGAGLMLVSALVLAQALPAHREKLRVSYPELLRSLGSLTRQEPVLRRRAIYGALSFGAFSVVWTSLAFLLAGRPYHFGAGVIGLFGLAGAAGALAASAAGRLADQGRAASNTVLAAVLVAGSFLPLWLGRHSLASLLVGILVLDVGVQGIHITNQSQIYQLRQEANSRVNAVYMTGYFIGGAIGSTVSAFSYGAAGWAGVAVTGGAFGATLMLVVAGGQLRRWRSSRHQVANTTLV
ncbi:MAG: MFS transporter [Mycobacteriales bacterium]